MRSSHDITLKLRHYSNSLEDCLPVRKGDGLWPRRGQIRLSCHFPLEIEAEWWRLQRQTRDAIANIEHCFICQWTINKASDIIKSLHNRQLRFSLLTRWEFPLWRKTSKKIVKSRLISSHTFSFFIELRRLKRFVPPIETKWTVLQRPRWRLQSGN